LEVVEESGRVRRTNTTGLNGSVRSQVKGVNTIGFGSSVEQEVWNPTDLGGGVSYASPPVWK